MKHRIKSAATLIGVHPNTIKNYIESGKIAADKDASGYWTIEESEINRFLGQWSDDSDEEAAREIGKQYILEQIDAKIAAQQQFIREHLRGIKPDKIGQQVDGLFEALSEVKFLTNAKLLVESIKIPSSAVIEWPGEDKEETE